MRIRQERFPDSIHIYCVDLHLPEDQRRCPCHRCSLTPLGREPYDVVETLEYQPPKARIWVSRNYKYCCPECLQCGIFSDPHPRDQWAGRRFAPSVLAALLLIGYPFHSPYYRKRPFWSELVWYALRSTVACLPSA